jgi:DNA-binding MarR family transcriptional regulator
MRAAVSTDHLLEILRETVVALVRQDGPDLSARQFAIFLMCYVRDDAQIVRGLAAQLRIDKTAVTRALDRLTKLGLAQRQRDPRNRRSVTVQRTASGNAFLRQLTKTMNDAAASVAVG